MKSVTHLIFTLFLFFSSPIHTFAQKTREELDNIQKEIDDYYVLFRDIMAPVGEQNNITKSVFDDPDFGKVQAEIDKLYEISTQALKRIDSIPVYNNETWLKPAARKYALEFQRIAGTDLPRLLAMRKNPSAYSETQYLNLRSDIMNALGDADRNYTTAPYLLLANQWAVHTNEAFCSSFKTYFDSMKDHFESLKSAEDPDIPMTWNCNAPFAGALRSYINRMGKTTCQVQFFSSGNFGDAKSIHTRLWVYLLSCKPENVYIDCFTIKTQGDIDRNNENAIDYLLRFPGSDEVIVRLRKSLGLYFVELVFEPFE